MPKKGGDREEWATLSRTSLLELSPQDADRGVQTIVCQVPLYDVLGTTY